MALVNRTPRRRRLYATGGVLGPHGENLTVGLCSLHKDDGFVADDGLHCL